MRIYTSRNAQLRLAILPILGVLTAGLDLLSIRQFGTVFGQAANAKPNNLGSQSPLAPIAEQLGIPSAYADGIALLLVVAAGSALRIYLIRFNQATAHAIGQQLSLALFTGHLKSSYLHQTSRHSSESIAEIQKSQALVNAIIVPFGNAVAATLSAAGILIAMLGTSKAATVVAVAPTCIGFALVSHLARNKIIINSKALSARTSQKTRALLESINSTREIIMYGTADDHGRQFKSIDTAHRKAIISNALWTQVPRWALEPIATGAILILVLGGLGASGITTAAVIGYSAIRLSPALQRIHASMSMIRGAYGLASDVLQSLQQANLNRDLAQELGAAPIDSGCIQLDNVSFQYPNTQEPTLRGCSLELQPGSAVGIIGETGSGKSTFLDLLMGLFPPTSGSISMNGVAITADRLSAYRNHFAYVSQAPHISDESIAFNITLSKGSPDTNRLHSAVEAAQLQDLIASLPDGIQTKCGESGSRFSGGQRQRIAIARALYREYSVLVLDEATSALDEQTEGRVTDAIARINPSAIVVIVAHRRAALARVDSLLEIRDGSVICINP